MKHWLVLTTAFLIAGAWGASAAWSGPSPLQASANQVFAYDNRHPNVLPANKVRALAIALAFHDEQGALKLIAGLKKRVPKN